MNNWENLRDGISTLQPEGKDGFEGFVARLFEQETAVCYYVARKGDQPVGDAYSPRAAIALQTKLYTSSSVSENEVEGDIDRILREAPVLDTVVIATTAQKGLAQLAARLTNKTHETGLDILLFVLGAEPTPFGALCLAHWGVVKEFIPARAAKLGTWAAAELLETKTQSALQLARGEIGGLTTRKSVSDSCREQLTSRFQGRGAGARTHNRIFLAEAVARPALNQQLHQWWEQKAAPVAVLQGEEGMGKTWVAARFVDDLFKTGSPIVFWLDSSAWANTSHLEEIVDIALKDIVLVDDTRVVRIKRKIFHQWNEPILLVLDGANEHDARLAAEQILRDYAKHRDELQNRVRLLFTSRPLDQRQGVRRNFWETGLLLPVGPFSEAEFQHALKVVAAGLRPEEFATSVRAFAMIPRYFRICVRLRSRLASMRLLTKEVLLWVDLQDKLESGDPQLTALGEELRGNPEEILAELAKRAGWPSRGQSVVGTEELQRSFPDFLKVRTDLIEQRIIVDANFDSAKLSPDHVVLGWALVLKALAEQHAGEDVDVLRERLTRKLEPAAANDDKVRAVHAAALLVFLDEPRDIHVAQRTRSALLSFWATHHNAMVDDKSLEFFLQSDLRAYARAIEILFREYLSGNLETLLIEPLARVWRGRSGSVDALRAILVRWLRLVYPGDASGSKNRDEIPPAQFAKAESPQQLRLSYAAISVISLRPEGQLLEPLIDCRKSQRFCYEDRDGDANRHFPLKNISSPLGILLRWSYTECILPELQTQARQFAAGGKDAENLLVFARLLRLAELPKEIGEAKDIIRRVNQAQRQFENFQEWLGETGPTRRMDIGFGSLQQLAVRRDLAVLDQAKVGRMCSELPTLNCFGTTGVT